MADNQSAMTLIEQTLHEYMVAKAPALPENIKEILVKIAPWVTLVVLIVTLPLVLLALGLGALVAPFAFLAGPVAGLHYGAVYMVSMLVLGVTVVLQALSLPGLFKRSESGWRFAYYGVLVSVLYNLVSFNLVSAIIGGAIGFYFLFQVRSYYGSAKQAAPPMAV